MKNLTEKALLINLTIRQWTARKYDRKVTDEVNHTHNTSDAGRFNKVLIAKNHLEAIGKIAGRARQFHYDNTLPWSDNGERMLPATNYMEYVSKLGELKNEFETELNKFAAEYPSMIEEAKKNLNGLFNQSDYPNDIRDRFEIKTSFMPMPDVQDFRVELSEVEMNLIRKNVEVEINDRFSNAQCDIYDRITDQLKKMHERLIDANTTFRDSLFENVIALVDLLPRLNVTDDANITSLCASLKALYVNPDNVRKDSLLRANKAKEVEALMNKVSSFFQPVAV